MTIFKSIGVAASLLLASPALADGPAYLDSTVVPVFPVTQVAPAAANDWSGFYAGGMVTIYMPGVLTRTELIAEPPPNISTHDLVASSVGGGFAGYNIQYGAFVLGGELAVSFNGPANDNNSLVYQTVYDLKARAGYSFGNVLAYGVVGSSYADLLRNTQYRYPSAGFTYGAGVDYKIGEHLFVGAEYLVRQLDGDLTGSPAQDSVSSTIQSAQLRVGWKF